MPSVSLFISKYENLARTQPWSPIHRPTSGVIGEDAAVLGDPFGLRPRDAPGRLAGLPDTEEPDEVESVLGQPVELRVGYVVECRRLSGGPRELRETDPRVHLEEGGISGCGHGASASSRMAC
jgi:hypothetical protein